MSCCERLRQTALLLPVVNSAVHNSRDPNWGSAALGRVEKCRPHHSQWRNLRFEAGGGEFSEGGLLASCGHAIISPLVPENSQTLHIHGFKSSFVRATYIWL